MAEVRLLCSGACRVLGLGDLPLLGRPAALPLAPGEFSPPSAFPGLSQSCGPAAPPQRGSPSCCDNRISHGRMPLHSDVLYYSGEISERQEKEETRSGVPSHPHDEPQRASSGSPSVLVWFLTGKLCPCWEPPMHPRVRFVNRLPLALLSGYPSWAFCNYPWQGDLSRLQSVPADHKWPLIFHLKFGSFLTPPPTPAYDGFQSSSSCICNWDKAALSYFSVGRLSLLSGI